MPALVTIDRVAFEAYVPRWLEHHMYWYLQAVPFVVYRFEDALLHPWAMIDSVLKATGLWEMTEITGTMYNK